MLLLLDITDSAERLGLYELILDDTGSRHGNAISFTIAPPSHKRGTAQWQAYQLHSSKPDTARAGDTPPQLLKPRKYV